MIRRLLVALTAALFSFPPAAAYAAFGSEFVVNTYTEGAQFLSKGRSVARDSDGAFLVVWGDKRFDQSARGVLARIHDADGNPLTDDFVVNSYTAGRQEEASVAVATPGTFVVVWASYGQDGDGHGIFTRRFDASRGALGSDVQVNSYTTGWQNDTAVSCNPSGACVVVWESFGQDGSTDGVFGRLLDEDGDFSSSEFQVNTYTTERQDTGGVAIDADGEFVIVWESFGQDGDGWGVFGRRFGADGAPLGGEFQVNNTSIDRQAGASVASDAAGNFAVAWESANQDGFSSGVFARMFDQNGAALGSEFQVNLETAKPQDEPSVACTPSGEFVVVWESAGQDGDRNGVFGRRFRADGTPLGKELPINTFTHKSQDDASVAIDPSGAFVVVWESFEQDDEGDAIVGRVFAPSPIPTTTTTTTTSLPTTTTTVPAGICGDPIDLGPPLTSIGESRVILASDALFILRTAVGLTTCALCECDVDDSGTIVTRDALAVLKFAVGQSIALDCPPCS